MITEPTRTRRILGILGIVASTCVLTPLGQVVAHRPVVSSTSDRHAAGAGYGHQIGQRGPVTTVAPTVVSTPDSTAARTASSSTEILLAYSAIVTLLGGFVLLVKRTFSPNRPSPASSARRIDRDSKT